MIDEKIILAQQKEMNSYSDVIYQTRRQLTEYKDNLNSAWAGEEMIGINDSLDTIGLRLNKIISDIDDIEHDILLSFQEMTEEEKLLAQEKN